MSESRETSYGTLSLKEQENFWEKCKKSEGCWNWQTGKKGTFAIKGKVADAGRIAYELTNGKIVKGYYLYRRCDNIVCINPLHLFIGPRGSRNAEFLCELEDKEVSGVIMRPVDQQRFWSAVNKSAPNGCWEWVKSRDKDGYGRLYVVGKYLRANRVGYQLGHGSIADDLLVCHKCDNPPCVNPDHLFVGTAQDNASDMKSKLRQIRGIDQRDASVTEGQVIQIKLLLAKGKETHEEIAGMIGCSLPVVDNIACGASWSHVGNDIDLSNRRTKGNYKLTESDVKVVKILVQMNVTYIEIGRRFGVTKSCISRIVNGKNWKKK